MIELTGKSMNKNSTDLLGGMIEKPIEIDRGNDVFEAMYSELEEEACIHKKDIQDSYLRAIYLNSKTNVGFYFEITLNLTTHELKERFGIKNKDPDIKSLKDFSREDYLEHLKNHRSSNNNFVAEAITI